MQVHVEAKCGYEKAYANDDGALENGKKRKTIHDAQARLRRRQLGEFGIR
jgi:hypothetical protein